MPRLAIVLLPFLALALTGCLARTAFDVVTAPVRAAGKAVDLVTTSQSEADEKRGREIRRREEHIGRLERDRLRAQEQCSEGSDRACRREAELRQEIASLLPTVPFERERR